MNSREFKKGDILEILNDSVSEKAPCTCTVVGVRPRGIIVEHADADEIIDHDRFSGHSVEKGMKGQRRFFTIR